MNTRRLMAALGFALLCSGLFTWLLSRRFPQSTVSPALPMRRVVVANKNLTAGDSLTTSTVTTVNIPTTQPLPGLFSGPQDLAGRVLLVPVSAGEPISLHDLANNVADTSLAATIPDGLRAISVPATEQPGGAPITPGNHVDVFVSYRSDGDAASVSSLVVQNITVLRNEEQKAAGNEARGALTTPNTITLLLSPDDAARLTAASAAGKLTFALRNRTDKTLSAGLNHVTLETPTKIAGTNTVSPSLRSSRPLAAPTATRGFVVETLAGGKSSTQTFLEGTP